MKYTHLIEIPAPPTRRTQQSRKAWKMTGVACAAAACMLWTTAQAQTTVTAGSDTAESWISTELNTAYNGLTTSGTGTTAAQLNAAITAALKERTSLIASPGAPVGTTAGSSLPNMPQLSATAVGSFVGTIIADRAAAGDGVKNAGAFVTAAIAGLKASTMSADVYTSDNIAAIVASAGQAVAAQLTGSSAAAVLTKLTPLETAALAATVIPVDTLTITGGLVTGTNRIPLAAKVVAALSTVSFQNGGTQYLPGTQIASIANAAVTAVAPATATVAVRNSAVASITTAILQAVNVSNYTGINDIVVPLLSALPVGTQQSAFQAVLSATTESIADAKTIIATLPNGLTSYIPAVTAVTAELMLNSTLSETGTAVSDLITTSGTVSVARYKVAVGVAAGAALADPAHASSYISTALAAETYSNIKITLVGTKVTTGTTSFKPAAADEQTLVSTVVKTLAASDPLVGGSSAISTTITNFIQTYVPTSGTASTAYFYKPADKILLAKALVAAALTGNSADSHQAALADILNNPQFVTVLSGSISVSGGIGALVQANTAGIQAYARTLITGLGTTDPAAISTFANTAVQSPLWTGTVNAANAMVFADATAGSGTPVGTTAAVRSYIAAGIATANPSLSGSLVTDISSQFTTANNTANNASAATVGAAIINAAGSNTVTSVMTALDTVVDAKNSILTTYGAASDRATLASAIAKAVNPSLSGTVAALAIANSTVDPNLLSYSVASAVIKLNPTNTTVLNNTIDATFAATSGTVPANALANQVLYIQQVVKAAGTVGGITAASEAGYQLEHLYGVPTSGTAAQAFYANVFTTLATVPVGSTVLPTTLQASTMLGQIAAGFARNDTTNIAAIVGGALKPTSSAIAAGNVAKSVAATVLTNPAAVTAADQAAVVIGAKTAVNLGAIGNAVVAADGPAATGVTNDLAGKLPSLSATVVTITTKQPALTTMVNDLGSLAGALANGLGANAGDPTTIQNIIAASTSGSVTTGTSIAFPSGTTLDLANVMSSGTSLVLSSTAKFAVNIVTFASKATTATLTKNAIPFFANLLAYEKGPVLGLTDVGTVSSFASKVINATPGQAQYLAQGTAQYGATGAGLSNDSTLALTGALSNLVTVFASKATTAAGLALSVTTPTLSGTIAYQFAKSIVATGTTTALKAAAVTAQIAVATKVVSAGLSTALTSYTVAQDIGSLFTSGTDKANLAGAMVTAVSTILAGPVLNEHLGQMVSAITAGLTNMSDIGLIIGKAINAKASAAYDIFGSVAAQSGNWTLDQLNAVKGAAFNALTLANQSSGLIQAELAQAIADLSANHFQTGVFNPSETPVN